MEKAGVSRISLDELFHAAL